MVHSPLSRSLEYTGRSVTAPSIYDLTEYLPVLSSFNALIFIGTEPIPPAQPQSTFRQCKTSRPRPWQKAARVYILQELVTREDLRFVPDNLALRLTVRMGVMMAGAVAIVGMMVAIF